MTRARDLRELSDDALDQRLAETKEELFNLRFQHATGQLDNTTRLGELKRETARLFTLRRQREIEAAEALTNQEVGR
ncbi:MAG: large subunit ribosomal protein [Actinomycetota bacterium]|jgi:large subunit ribosomal protein L29|nr:large subunit ribosomal protein [Actinomycetota bacterium]